MATTVTSASDTDGNVYEICKQSMIDTCIPASIFMYECMVRQASMQGGEDRINRISAKYQGNAASTGGDGTTFENLLSIIQYIGVRVTQIDDFGTDWIGLPNFVKIKPGRINITNPALVIVGWYDKYLHVKRAGGHGIVAARFSSGGRVVYLDPWQGSICEELNNSTYNVRGRVETVFYSG